MLFTLPDDDTLYTALENRDPRYDGQAFVGVTSTGIFCRLTCPARNPKRENCRFFASAADCLTHGFRPCLRCHPAASGDPSLKPLLKALNEHTAKERSLCSELRLARVESARKMTPHSDLLKYKNAKDKDGFVPDLSGIDERVLNVHRRPKREQCVVERKRPVRRVLRRAGERQILVLAAGNRKPVHAGLVEGVVRVDPEARRERTLDDGYIYYLAGTDKTKFKRSVIPGDQLRLEVEIINLRTHWMKAQGKAFVDDTLVCSSILTCAEQKVS